MAEPPLLDPLIPVRILATVAINCNSLVMEYLSSLFHDMHGNRACDGLEVM
jgi:hypothetical protein